jgi:hypothetical protein
VEYKGLSDKAHLTLVAEPVVFKILKAPPPGAPVAKPVDPTKTRLPPVVRGDAAAKELNFSSIHACA